MKNGKIECDKILAVSIINSLCPTFFCLCKSLLAPKLRFLRLVEKDAKVQVKLVSTTKAETKKPNKQQTVQ